MEETRIGKGLSKGVLGSGVLRNSYFLRYYIYIFPCFSDLKGVKGQNLRELLYVSP